MGYKLLEMLLWLVNHERFSEINNDYSDAYQMGGEILARL